MSYTVATPGGKARPGTVTAASLLLFVGAAVELVSLAISLTQLGPMLSAVEAVYADQPGADTVSTVTAAGAIGGATISGLLAVATIVLGILLRSGKNPARIVTWILGGIGVLCNVCSLGGAALTSSLNGGTAATPEAEELQRRLNEIIPAWQTAIATIAAVILMLVLLVVIILLALPASNEFFRKEQQVWVPPTMPGGSSGGLPPALPAPHPLPEPPSTPSVPPQG